MAAGSGLPGAGNSYFLVQGRFMYTVSSTDQKHLSYENVLPATNTNHADTNIATPQISYKKVNLPLPPLLSVQPDWQHTAI